MLGARPKVTVLYHYFHPDDVVSARHFDGLCQGLAARGWDVLVRPCNRGCRDETHTYPLRETWDGVQIRRVWRPRFRQATTFGRLVNAVWILAAWSLPIGRRPDVLIVGTDPILSVLVATVWRLTRRGVKVAHWAFDLYPEAAVADGLLPADSRLVRVLRAALKVAYSCCDLIADLGACMRSVLATYNPPGRKATLVPWALSEPDQPMSADPSVRRELLGHAALGLLYSGNFGRAHSYEEFLELGRRLRGSGAVVCYAVRGNRAEEVRRAVGPDDANVTFAGFAPEEELETRLAAADVHLVSLRPEWTGVVVPSKFFGSLAAGRPVVFAGRSDSAIAGWIREHGIGWVLTSDNSAEVAADLRELAAAPHRLAELQRHCHTVYREHFSWRAVMDEWDRELRALLLRPRSAALRNRAQHGPGGHLSITPTTPPATTSKTGPLARPPSFARRLLRTVGINQAVGYGLLHQAVAFGAKPVSLFMMVAFLTLEEQGFQYTFSSVLGLKVFFELGLGLVIIQFAGHEAGKLTPAADGTLSGDPIAKARLGSLLRKQTIVFASLAAAYSITVLPAGWIFFARSPDSAAVAWQTAWVATVIATALGLPLAGVCAVLFGCGQVAAMARLNLVATSVQLAINWATLAAGAGLLAAPISVLAGLVVNAAGVFALHYGPLADLWRAPPVATVHWQREVWPLQWKVAVSWLCTYLTTQLFNPLVLWFDGSAAAGRIGLTLALASMLQAVGWGWVGARLPAFAGLVARREFSLLDTTFFRALTQATAVVLIGAAAMIAGVAVSARLGVEFKGKLLADRFLTTEWVAVACAAAVGWHLIECLAGYFHCFKRDPFLVVKIAGAAVCVPTAYILCRFAGPGPMLAGYLAVTMGIGLGIGVPLFVSRRRALQAAELATAGGVE